MRVIHRVALAVLIAMPAAAADAVDPGTLAWNNKIAATTPGTDGVFVVQADGTIRHVQSGMVCPAKFPSVKLWHLELFPSRAGKGTDVSCDYGRNGPDNRFVSKLTLFATIAPDGWTQDQVFANYRAEVLRVNPGAHSTGPLIAAPGELPLPRDWKTEAFVETHDGRTFTSELIVALRGKWMFEVRTTYDGSQGDPMQTMQSSIADVTNAQNDRRMAAAAYRATVGTLPK